MSWLRSCRGGYWLLQRRGFQGFRSLALAEPRFLSAAFAAGRYAGAFVSTAWTSGRRSGYVPAATVGLFQITVRSTEFLRVTFHKI